MSLYRNLSTGCKFRWQRIGWYARQLFPLTYRSAYRTQNETRFCVWKMWLGRCFKIDDMQVCADGGAPGK